MNEIGSAVIGGGASGLMAAFRLAERGISALVLEAQDKTGRKLLATGNGRCNLSNAHVSPGSYANPFAAECIRKYGFGYVRDVFERIGIPYRIDPEGRAYPASGQASGVLDALRFAALSRGAQIRENARAVALKRENGAFVIKVPGSPALRCRSVLLACGGCAYPSLGGTRDGYRLAEMMGHRTTATSAGLAPLRADPEAVRGLKGVRAPARVSLQADGDTVDEKSGEVLFGSGTLSGIVSMELASSCEKALGENKSVFAVVSFIEGARHVLDRRIRLMPDRDAYDIFNGALPRMLSFVLAREAGVRRGIPAGDMTEEEVSRLSRLAEGWPIRIHGTEGFESAQVTCGGLATELFDPDTMMSKAVPGLYAAGEVLDVDGPCGGFNLHWAWASALCAADDIARIRV